MNDSRQTGKRRTRWTRYLLEGSAFIAILALIYAFQTRHLISSDEVPAPSLTGRLVNGETMDLSTVQGKRTLVYFFAPWCGYCSASMDNINRLRQRESESYLAIVLVALDWESQSQIEEYITEHELQVPVLLASPNVAEAWRVYAFPTYYVLDEQHRIVARDLGYSTLLGLLLRT